MKLIKVSTYAKQNDKSISWAYKQINKGKVKVKVIDKVTFVKIN